MFLAGRRGHWDQGWPERGRGDPRTPCPGARPRPSMEGSGTVGAARLSPRSFGALDERMISEAVMRLKMKSMSEEERKKQELILKNQAEYAAKRKADQEFK